MNYSGAGYDLDGRIVTTWLNNAGALMNFHGGQVRLCRHANISAGSLTAGESWLRLRSSGVECCKSLIDHLMV